MVKINSNTPSGLISGISSAFLDSAAPHRDDLNLRLKEEAIRRITDKAVADIMALEGCGRCDTAVAIPTATPVPGGPLPIDVTRARVPFTDEME